MLFADCQETVIAIRHGCPAVSEVQSKIIAAFDRDAPKGRRSCFQLHQDVRRQIEGFDFLFINRRRIFRSPLKIPSMQQGKQEKRRCRQIVNGVLPRIPEHRFYTLDGGLSDSVQGHIALVCPHRIGERDQKHRQGAEKAQGDSVAWSPLFSRRCRRLFPLSFRIFPVEGFLNHSGNGGEKPFRVRARKQPKRNCQSILAFKKP